MSTTMTSPLSVPELDPVRSDSILDSLYRINVDKYERLVETGVLGDQRVELIGGLLVRKRGKRPPHVIACEALRDELLLLIPQRWRLTIEAPIRIPEFDEPEPDLAIVRGTRELYEERHPGPADVGLLIEVADTTLDRDRGEKEAAYARGGVPTYWILNLVDRQLEICTGPTPTGYRDRRILPPGEHVSLSIDGNEIGRIVVGSILPRNRVVDETGAKEAP
jgi:Uma2 family endonuclease